jgi:prepilin peptidase CpaA
MDESVLLHLLAVVLAVTAAIFDLRQHRIPNWLTYPGMLIGLVARWVVYRHDSFLGWKGLASGFAGLLLAGGVMFIFFAVRAMGAGDVKIMAAIGAFVGPGTAVSVLLATAICGGVLAIGYALYRKRMVKTLKNLASVLRFHAWAGVQAHPEVNLDNPEALRMPYGLAIALGTLYAFAMVRWR